MTDEFFESRRAHSAAKSLIVVNYFTAWANVLKAKNDRLAYIDLYSGPGKYEDGVESVPLRILQQAVSEPELRARLMTIFNDVNPRYAAKLQQEIAELPGVDKLAHKPQVSSIEVGSALAERLAKLRLPPSLSFVDPFGYKGLSKELIGAVLKDRGCDCIAFFNYSRVIAACSNSNRAIQAHMASLLTREGLERIRALPCSMAPAAREEAVLEELKKALKSVGAQYVLPFRMAARSYGGKRYYYVVFATKNSTARDIMKDIMRRAASKSFLHGVASYEYDEVDSEQLRLDPSSAWELQPLCEELLRMFSGQAIGVGDIIRIHGEDTLWTARDYKQALKRLEADNRIEVVPRAGQRRVPNTMADHLLAVFPGMR